MFAENKGVQRQSVLSFEFRYTNFPTATGAAIAIVEPPRLDRTPKLHLRLAVELFEKIRDLFF